MLAGEHLLGTESHSTHLMGLRFALMLGLFHGLVNLSGDERKRAERTHATHDASEAFEDAGHGWWWMGNKMEEGPSSS